MNWLKLIFIFIFTFSIKINYGQSNCGVIYVSPTGSVGTGTGTQSNPTTIINAIDSAKSKDIIRMAIGTYNINNALFLKDSITLEGGFNPANNWSKTSQAGATTINRTNANPEGAANQQRLVCFYGVTVSGFRLQDLTITTANGTSNGMSTYGVHLINCTNYNIVRTQILPGNAAAGAIGTTGSTGGNGGNGGTGRVGDDDNDAIQSYSGAGGGGCSGANGGTSVITINNTAGLSGNTGATSTSTIAGGGGGSGGSGGREGRDGGRGGYGGGVLSTFGTNTIPGSCTGHRNSGNWWGDESGGCNSSVVKTSAESGRCGANGTNGNNGLAGANGTAGAHVSNFFVPGGIGATGANGTGGQGGAGGGGGAGEGGTFCADGTGAGGGGGGGGGCGGYGGTGGRGGGGSFGIYGTNSATGAIIQSFILAGNAGAGGTGGNGGSGGSGGYGGAGGNGQSGEVGFGGNGGAGGNGGTGGNGGNGNIGVSINTYGTLPSYTAFSLSTQAIIVASLTDCSESNMYYKTNTSSTWNLDAHASPNSISGDSITVMYDTTGRFDLSFGGSAYIGFTQIINLTPSDANAGTDQYLCATSAALNSLTPTFGNAYWQSLGSAVITDSSNNNSAISNLVQGINLVTWRVNSNCCGYKLDTINLIVDLNAPSTGINISNQSTICGDTVTLVSNPSANGTQFFTWNFNNAAPSSAAGTFANGPHTIKFDSAGNQSVYLHIAYHNDACNYYDTSIINVSCVTLPVDLLAFDAKLMDNQVLLNWTTASETNNQHFEIWRSIDNEPFYYLEKTKSKAPMGNALQTLNYQYLDDIVPNAKILSYQLIQQDFNGQRTASAIANLFIANEQTITIYPNPLNNDLFVSNAKAIDKIEFYATDGALVYSITQPTITNNISHLNNGLYLIKIYNKQKITILKMMKVGG